MTEALDFLTTEDNKLLITEDSIYNEFTSRTPITTTWN